MSNVTSNSNWQIVRKCNFMLAENILTDFDEIFEANFSFIVDAKFDARKKNFFLILIKNF